MRQPFHLAGTIGRLIRVIVIPTASRPASIDARNSAMNKLHVLLMCGGGGSEHNISLMSANFLQQQLQALPGIDVTRVELLADRWQTTCGETCTLGLDKVLRVGDSEQLIDYVVPCIHGFRGKPGIFNPCWSWRVCPIWGVALRGASFASTRSAPSCG